MFLSLDTTKAVLSYIAPDMPSDFWIVTLFVLGILTLTAAIDIFTAHIPDILIYTGLLTVTATQGFLVSWDNAAHHFFQAIMAGLLIWAINAFWYRAFKHDALGMGDAKWTMLVVICFGVTPALLAWGIGAVLAVLFISTAHLSRHKIRRVTFAPFLLAGLFCGLYWVSVKGP